MSKTQRKRRLRRRQVASQRRVAPARVATVAFTGSLLTAGLAVVAAPAAHAADSDVAMVEDLAKGRASSSPYESIAVGDRLFFSAATEAKGRELWVSDGSEAGTRLVKDIDPRVRRGNGYSSSPSDFTLVGETLYFVADGGAEGRQVWKTDGTAAGTVRVSDIREPSGVYDYAYGPDDLTAVGSTLFFTAEDATHGRELWKTDGTLASTVLVEDLNPGDDEDGDPLGGYPGSLTAIGDTLYFSATDAEHGRELWTSDGTAEGTDLVVDLNTGVDDEYDRPLGSSPSDFTELAGAVFFTADDGTRGRELWKTDGTAEGTEIVFDLNPTTEGYAAYYGPESLTVLGSSLFFAADNGTTGNELWKTDGTGPGTTLVKDIRPGTSGGQPRGSNIRYPVVLDGDLYFRADDGTHGRELWTSDGTTAGTRLVKDIKPGKEDGYAAGGDPRELLVVGDDLFFTAEDKAHGRQLWRTDGSTAGTRLFADVSYSRGYYSYGPTGLNHVGETLYFANDDGVYGRELWTTDSAATAIPRARNIARPTISGRPRPGSVLTASPGRWTPKGATFTYQWLVDGDPIRKATGRTFTLGTSNLGQKISVQVIASKKGFRSAIARSAETREVAVGRPITNKTEPAIRGTAKVGSTLTATRGAWKPKKVQLSFRWIVGGKRTDATGRTFRVPGSALGQKIVVKVTARKKGYAPEVVKSDPTGPVTR